MPSGTPPSRYLNKPHVLASPSEVSEEGTEEPLPSCPIEKVTPTECHTRTQSTKASHAIVFLLSRVDSSWDVPQTSTSELHTGNFKTQVS